MPGHREGPGRAEVMQPHGSNPVAALGRSGGALMGAAPLWAHRPLLGSAVTGRVSVSASLEAHSQDAGG